MAVLEFWLDDGAGPLWVRGVAVDPGELDVDQSLAERLVHWNADSAEDKIPGDGAGDARWIADGRSLLSELRRSTVGSITVVTSEPWWSDQRSTCRWSRHDPLRLGGRRCGP